MTLSLYNKYRPQVFKDVVGQAHIEKTLANAVESNKVSHAYLFCGPRGTGKTTTARILAKALLCVKAPTATPCGVCEHCLDIERYPVGTHPDVKELDAASRTSVDNVREEIIDRVSFAPTQGAYKIFIIDEVHMLSKSAFNALLKTLEEPPSHVIFVLCTTDVHKVQDTVQARCQRFDFKRITTEEIVGRLQYICEREGFDFEKSALELIAARSQGGMRDAIRSLEQAAVFSSGKITYEAAESLLGMVDTELLFLLCEHLAAGDAAACFGWVSDFVQSGSDVAILVNDLATHVRNLYAVQVAGDAGEEHLASALEIDAAVLPRLRKQALSFGTYDRLAWMLTVLGSLSAELKNAANARLALEIALTRMLYPQSETSLNALAARVAALEQRDGVGVPLFAEAKSGTPTPSLCSKAAPSPEQAVAEPEVTPNEQNNASLHRTWNKALDSIKEQRRGVAAHLGGVLPALSKDGTTLILELPAEASTSKQYLESETNAPLLREAAEKAFGKPLVIRLTLAQASPGSKPSGEVFDIDPYEEPSQPSGLAVHEEQRPEPVEEPYNESGGIAGAEPNNEPKTEPSKEELENILSASLGSQIQFEE
ncbi:MAG: DNA polymerase III subunit gamma/tau [Coriobacteriia bacterium]|nr:DNA polymerase III subunit gamma/tau [Coriobacteriia bacterium]